MDVASILVPSSVRCEPQCTSKKNALELLSRMLAEASNVTSGQVLDGLAARERLGSTGLGASVAMPHTRVDGIDRSVGAFLRLAVPVSFDSPDGLPVDLLFGLLLPADATAAELTELRELVKKLRDPDLQLKLRAADDPDEIYDLLTDNLTILRPTPIHRTSGG
jgi:PTS system nitrogen regulatory IIA component